MYNFSSILIYQSAHYDQQMGSFFKKSIMWGACGGRPPVILSHHCCFCIYLRSSPKSIKKIHTHTHKSIMSYILLCVFFLG